MTQFHNLRLITLLSRWVVFRKKNNINKDNKICNVLWVIFFKINKSTTQCKTTSKSNEMDNNYSVRHRFSTGLSKSSQHYYFSIFLVQAGTGACFRNAMIQTSDVPTATVKDRSTRYWTNLSILSLILLNVVEIVLLTLI